MRLYGALSELAELIIRLASGKTVKVSASEQTAAGETVVTIPNVVDGADEFVMKDTQQSLTKKTLSGSVTTDGFGNKTSDTILTNPDITANKLALPAISNETDRPNDTRAVGALHWRTPDNRLIAGTGSEYRVLVDESSSQSLFLKTLNNSSLSGGSVVGGTIGNASNPVSIDRISKLQISPGITGTNINQVAITNASGELVTESALAKIRGGFGFNATDITIPNPSSSGAYTVVGDSLSQTLSNKTIGSVTAENGVLSVVGTGALRLPFGDDTQKPGGIAANLKGMIRYNDQQDAFEGYNELSGWSALGGGGASERVSQTGLGVAANFPVGTPLYVDATLGWQKAKADAANTAEVAGILGRRIDDNTVEVTLAGEVAGVAAALFENPASLPPRGELVFLSPTTAGKLTATEPTVVGQVSKPVGIVHNVNAGVSVDIMFFNMRGVVVGGANLRTQIGLNGAALVSQTTNIQNVTAYTAGELSGWVYIDATTDRRFYIQVQFVKDAANAWKCAYQTTGDTPPAGFNVDVIVSGSDAFVQVQMPPVAGFSSANINFALNAPAVGATLPLQVDSANVSFTNIQAASSAGITFKEDGNTTVGSVSDAGAWSFGPSGNTTNRHAYTGYGIRHNVSLVGPTGANNTVTWLSPFPVGTCGSFVVFAINASTNGAGRVDFVFQNSPGANGIVYTNLTNMSGTTVSMSNNGGFIQFAFTFLGIGGQATSVQISCVVLGNSVW